MLSENHESENRRDQILLGATQATRSNMVGEGRRILKPACQASLSENTGKIRLFKWRMY